MRTFSRFLHLVRVHQCKITMISRQHAYKSLYKATLWCPRILRTRSIFIACAVKSYKNGRLYELDRDRKGPVNGGCLEQIEDVLLGKALGRIRESVGKVEFGIGFRLLALALFQS
ncbi:uncharacterized protein BCR38DRAFT_406090 [Pseudomassariella vexata]|uniref:Uncharacterized protein n=1 Tax=Pseudomassariella vexata TaxID=1141098 RepID=A0A1Y2EFY1_9PEZI|nr:uncharacterized protein BCR38DRAFT_406090 [Pseudomassariella vexata]ORY70488.1 hypothetical protein BCR38DRAFT_406090 [Pseudomassariella vexata]